MSTKLSLSISIILILIGLFAGLFLSAQLPDPMPSHWNAAGQVDGYMPKVFGVWMMPVITFLLVLLLAFIPSLDPLKANVETFRSSYNLFLLVFVGFMLYVHLLVLFASLGWQFNMVTLMMPAMGLLFIMIGYMMQNTKRNYFIGIRTPWTLSSDYVWDETHKLGAKTFMLAGVVVFFSSFFGVIGVFLMLVALLLGTLIPIAYSYRLHQKSQQH